MQSLWSATATPAVTLPPLADSERAQVIVIGGGYTGLSAALHLAQAGRDVVVLEASWLGEGGSGLNGGQVIPGVKHDPDALEQMFGPTLGARMVETVGSAADLVFDLIRRHRIACAPLRTGWIQPVTSEAALAPIERRVKQWRQRGAEVAVLDRREVSALLGSEYYIGGWIDRRAGSVQPLSYLRGLAAAAQAFGVRIYVRSPAIKLDRSADGWGVQTALGHQVTAGTVIIATNAYSGALHEPLRRSVVAVPSFQVATEPIPPSLRSAILPQRQPVSDTQPLLRYFRLDADGRLVLGSRGFFGGVPPELAARHHYRAVREIFPLLSGLRYDYHWGGMVAMTADHLPHLHELAPGLLAGLGYNGRGVAMATTMGRLLARRVLGESETELGFPITPVRPIALHRFSRIGVRLAVQYLRIVDEVARARRVRAGSTA